MTVRKYHVYLNHRQGEEMTQLVDRTSIVTEITTQEKRVVANMLMSGKTSFMTQGKVFEIRQVESSILVRVTSDGACKRAII